MLRSLLKSLRAISLAILFACILPSSNSTPAAQNKLVVEGAISIIGGVPASQGEFPWLVSVMARNSDGTWTHSCGGTLIDYGFVITAAHCVLGFTANQLQIVAGAHRIRDVEISQQRRQVDAVKVHLSYNLQTQNYDIARLSVSVPFQATEFVDPVLFPPEFHTATGNCWIAGWGVTESDSSIEPHVLRKASLPIVSKPNCARIYPNFDNSTQICAGHPQGGVDACSGDTGGPLMCNDLSRQYFAGIISWGYLCATPGYPGVYTEISRFMNWIVT